MVKFYKILDKNLLAKLDNNVPYLLIDGQWIVDKNSILMDRLVGYDKSEPDDSPYKFGNTDMLDRVEHITEEEALQKE